MAFESAENPEAEEASIKATIRATKIPAARVRCFMERLFFMCLCFAKFMPSEKMPFLSFFEGYTVHFRTQFFILRTF